MQLEEEKYVTGFSKTKRKKLRSELDQFVTIKAESFGHPEEAIVQEIRYWQQSAAKAHTNPTRAQREKSFEHWQGICLVCKKRIASISAATFHHLKRGVPNLHAPENMQPLHRDESFGCHEKLHGAPAGCLTAGSMRQKV